MHTPKHRSPRSRWASVAAAVTCVALSGARMTPRSADSPFLAECNAAMAKMMTAMRITSHGDDDGDFAALMIAHHEGAIAMARAELRFGKNEQLRRLAQEMIITQQQEIVAMRMAIRTSPSRDSSALAPTGDQR
jgi:uncharacterized protein (DUF305 family)